MTGTKADSRWMKEFNLNIQSLTLLEQNNIVILGGRDLSKQNTEVIKGK